MKQIIIEKIPILSILERSKVILLHSFSESIFTTGKIHSTGGKDAH